MVAKGEQLKNAEDVQFAAYKQFCEHTTAEKRKSITEAEEKVEMLKAVIATQIAESDKLTREIDKLDADIASWESQEKTATKDRATERADYEATHKDYTESINAIQSAIPVLKRQSADVPQASSLAQVRALKDLHLIPQNERHVIDNFLSEAEDDLDMGVPQANAYEFQSFSIITMLEKLEDKFVDERSTLEKEEMNSRHQFQLLMQELKAQIDTATKSRTEKTQERAKAQEAKADAEGDLTEVTSTMNEDKAYLADLVSSCSTKASDFEVRQKLRVEEIQALSKAIEVIGGESVKGAGDKYGVALLLQKGSQAFAQLRADKARNPLQDRVAFYLESQAKQLNSRVLSTIAERAEVDPFTKVKKMIQDLVVRLLEEANDEASHKGWCDTELKTNEQTRNEKTEQVEKLRAEIDELTASIAELSEDITELTAAIAALASTMATATLARQEEKATNEETIEDAKAAQAAVAQALAVLKEFYAKAGQSTALLQRTQGKHTQPEIFDSPYTGMQAEGGGVIGMLEVIESNFARLEADATSSEVASQAAYDKLMSDSRVDKASKETSEKHKSQKKQEKEQALTQAKQDLEGTEQELNAALSYYEKLKPSCVNTGVSYEDRVRRRKEEIESLQEAARILDGESLAL